MTLNIQPRAQRLCHHSIDTSVSCLGTEIFLCVISKFGSQNNNYDWFYKCPDGNNKKERLQNLKQGNSDFYTPVTSLIYEISSS